MQLKSAQLTQSARRRAQQHSVETPMANTAIWFYPATERKQGCLILVHGYRGTHQGLEAIAGALPDFDIYIMDLPGFGATKPLKVVHTVENYALWLSEVVVKLDQPNAVIVAHSFGTLVTGCFASRNHVNRIALINPVSAPALTGPRGLLTRATAFLYRGCTRLPERLARRLLANPIIPWGVTQFMFHGEGRELKHWIGQQHREFFSNFSDTKSLSESFEASVSRNLQMYAEEITQPTLLVCTVNDDITAIDIQRKVAAKYHHATYVEVPKLGHLIHYEGPEIVAKHIREFCKATS